MKYISDTAFERLKEATTLTHTGVRHGFVDNLFTPEAYKALTDAFPDTSTFYLVDKQSGGGRKRFYVGPEYVVTRNFGSVHHLKDLPDVWKGFLEETTSPAFMKALEEATGVKFNSLTNFGLTYGDTGCVQEPHLDGAIRPNDTSPIKATIALLLYFNIEDNPVSATEIYDLDRTTVLAKGTTMKNSLLFFEQHKNSWHGFPIVPEGHTRQLLSLSYSYEKEPVPISFSLFNKIVPVLKWKWQQSKSK